jgi:hypothetical protein
MHRPENQMKTKVGTVGPWILHGDLPKVKMAIHCVSNLQNFRTVERRNKHAVQLGT